MIWMIMECKFHTGRDIYLGHLSIPSTWHIVKAQKYLLNEQRVNETKRRMLSFLNVYKPVPRSQNGPQWRPLADCPFLPVGWLADWGSCDISCPPVLLKHLVCGFQPPVPSPLSLSFRTRDFVFWCGCQGEGFKCLRRAVLAEDVGRQWEIVSFIAGKTKWISSRSLQGRIFRISALFLYKQWDLAATHPTSRYEDTSGENENEGLSS